MDLGKITKNEIDLLSATISQIVSTEIQEKDLSGNLPLVSELKDSNKVYTGKVAILFADMRESSHLPEKYNKDQLIKIYRSYVRTLVQAVRYSGGVVKDFMGDGILAVFLDGDNDDGIAEERAVFAARYIATTIDKVLNPKLDAFMKYRVSCGIGVYTGEVSLSKVGMRGKERDSEAESEFGIAWIGNCTNMACKFSGAVSNEDIFISTATYVALTEQDKEIHWHRTQLVKGRNVLDGYIASQYYLDLDEPLEVCIAEKSKQMTLADVVISEQKKIHDRIISETQKLEERKQEIKRLDEAINKRVGTVSAREANCSQKERILLEKEFEFHEAVIREAHCKSEYQKAMGIEFWEDHLQKMICVGAELGKNEHAVKQKISFVMVDIYQTFEMFDKAYDCLVEQATGYPWIHLFTVQKIVEKVKYCSRLQQAVSERLHKKDFSINDVEEFIKIQKWLDEYLK